MLHLASLTAGLTFDAWVHAHGKVYATEAARLHAASNFAANERRIAAHNADAHTWQMGHTQFSDLSDAEFASRVHRPGMARGGSPLSAVGRRSAGAAARRLDHQGCRDSGQGPGPLRRMLVLCHDGQH